MRAVRLGCIQLAIGRRKGGSDRDVRRPYDVQTVVALVSFSGGSLRAAALGSGSRGTDGAGRSNGLRPLSGTFPTPGSLSSALRKPRGFRNVVGTDPSMKCRVRAC